MTTRKQRICPHCGRAFTIPRPTHPLHVAAAAHIPACAKRTPAERLAANVQDEARWRDLGTTGIKNDPKHPGLVDPVKETPRE